MTITRVPNPGSAKAIEAGCVCPIVQNRHGHQPPLKNQLWWIDAACEVHRSWLTGVREDGAHGPH